MRSVREDPGALWTLVSTPYWADTKERQALWRPLASLSFGLTYLGFGEAPWPYHAFVLVTHGAVSALVALLAHRLLASPGAALAAGALFAVHPIHSEVLGDAVGRAETLSALFGLASLLAYARAREVRDRWFAGSAALFFLATLAKEGAFSFPLVFGLYDLFLRPGEAGIRARLRQAGPRWAALAAVGGAHLALRLAALGTLSPHFTAINRLDNPLLFEPVGWRVANGLRVMGRALRLLLWPHPLSADYSLDQIQVVRRLSHAPTLASIAGVAALVLFAIRARRSVPGFAVAWVLLAWLPASNLLFGAGTIFGERLLYLPSVGGCLLASAVASRIPAGTGLRKAAAAVGVALAAAGAVRTNLRLCDWRDDLRLWQVTASRDAPRSARAHGAYAVRLLEAGRRGEAQRELERTLEIMPEYYHVHGKLAEIRRSEGDRRGAAEEMLRALRGQIASYGREAPDAAAFLYAILRDFEAVADGMPEAARQFRALLEQGFDIPLLRAYLGEALAGAGEVAEAEEEYRRALAGPHPPVARASYAMFLFLRGRHDEALREAAAIRPDASTLARQRKHLVEGEIARARGAPERALEAFEAILADEEIDPAITDQARFGRGMAGADLGLALRGIRPEAARERMAGARADLETALRSLDPSGPVAANGAGRLVSVLSSLGEPGAAESLLRRTIAAQPGTRRLRLLLVGLLASRGRLAAARAEIASLRERSPEETNLFVWEGEFLLASGDPAGAKGLAARAASFGTSPKPGVRALAARADVALGNAAQGLPVLEALARERPADGTVAGWLGLALLDAGRLAEARGELLRGIERGVEDAAVFDALARILGGTAGGAETPDPAAAARFAERALSLAPGDPRFLRTRALLHLAAGENGKARALLERALPVLEDYAPALRAEVRALLEKAGG
ncbi:MAG TPA: tetratricopeptide repeat protein [Planctomycetota bacterium]|nr:tetratricopeptide repeat protein [Planctomycetota bacterium]